ncbi:MAG: hypothetical protein SNJ78_04965 [Spirochaetales bacterium]
MRVKKNVFYLMASLFISYLLLGGCATTPAPSQPEEKIARSTTPATSPTPEKKAKTIVERIPRVIKESILFPDGTVDEYTIYSYTTDGKLLLKEELFDAASKDLLEYSEYQYQQEQLVEKRTFDGNKKLKFRRTYTYSNNLLIEESQFNPDNVLQTRSVYSYDFQNRRIDWKTFDASGSLIGATRYTYTGNSKEPTEIELLNPSGTVDLKIMVNFLEGKKSREVFTTTEGKLEKEVMYRYDEQGRLLGETVFSPTRVKQSSIAYEYPADAFVPLRIVQLDGRDRPKKILVREYAFREESRVVYE